MNVCRTRSSALTATSRKRRAQNPQYTPYHDWCSLKFIFTRNSELAWPSKIFQSVFWFHHRLFKSLNKVCLVVLQPFLHTHRSSLPNAHYSPTEKSCWHHIYLIILFLPLSTFTFISSTLSFISWVWIWILTRLISVGFPCSGSQHTSRWTIFIPHVSELSVMRVAQPTNDVVFPRFSVGSPGKRAKIRHPD